MDQAQLGCAFRFETGFSRNQFFRIIIIRSDELYVATKIAGARFIFETINLTQLLHRNVTNSLCEYSRWNMAQG